MKTKVKTKEKDPQHKEYEKDEIGYIDGYIVGADGLPYAAAVLGTKIVLISPNRLEVITEENKLPFE